MSEDTEIKNPPPNPREAPQYTIPTGCDGVFGWLEKGEFYVVKIPYKGKDFYLGVDGKLMGAARAAAFKTEEAAKQAATITIPVPEATVVKRTRKG